MIEEMGTIVTVENASSEQVIWVETEIKTTCHSCQAQANCGTSVVAKAFASKKQTLKLSYALPVNVGQKVKLGIPEESLLNASVLVYLLPILGLMLGAVAGGIIFPLFALTSELWVILSSFTVAIGVFSAVKYRLTHSSQQSYCPQLIEVYPAERESILFKEI